MIAGMDDIKGRVVREIRQRLKISQSEVAQALSIHVSSLSKKERGGIPFHVSEFDALSKLFNVPYESWNQLFTDAIEAEAAARVASRRVGEREPAWHRDPSSKEIPIIQMTGASPPSDNQDPGHDNYRYLAIPPELVGDPDAFAVEIRGDSMVPAFPPGVFCVCAPLALVNDGDACFVQLNGDAPGGEGNTLKYVWQLEDGRMALKSANPQHKGIVAEPGSVVRVVKVVGVYTKIKWEKA